MSRRQRKYQPGFDWVTLCEAASCSPDFDVVYEFTDPKAVAWLYQRLDAAGHHYTYRDVEEALAAWRAKK